MSVATQPGHTALTSTPSPRSSAARMRVIALSAAFETEYAGVPAPIEASDPAPLEHAALPGVVVDGGVVDQHIEPADVAGQRFAERGHAVGVGDVDGPGLHPHALGAQGGGRRLPLVRIARAQQGREAPPGELAHDLEPYAAVGSGHERHSVSVFGHTPALY